MGSFKRDRVMDRNDKCTQMSFFHTGNASCRSTGSLLVVLCSYVLMFKTFQTFQTFIAGQTNVLQSCQLLD